MKRIQLLMILLLNILSLSAADRLQVSVQKVEFGTVSPGKTEKRTVLIENISDYTIDCTISLLSSNSLTPDAFAFVPSVNHESNVYNLWPGETAIVNFSYTPRAENEGESAEFAITVNSTGETHKVLLTADCRNTRVVRTILNDGKYRDYNAIDSLTTVDSLQYVWKDGEASAIPISAIDSILFLSMSTAFVPEVSQRGYRDSTENNYIEMYDNVIYVCADMDGDILDYDAETGIFYILNSPRVRELGIKEGDILYSTRRLPGFPNGYCLKISSLSYHADASEVRRHLAARKGKGLEIPNVQDFNGLYAYKVENVNMPDAFARVRQSSYGVGYRVPCIQTDTPDLEQPEEYTHENDLSFSLKTEEIGDILKAIFNDEITSLGLEYDHKKHQYKGEVKYGESKFKASVTLTDKEDAIKDFSFTLDKHTVEYNDKNNELVYKYSLLDKVYKESGLEAFIGARIGGKFDYDYDFDPSLTEAKFLLHGSFTPHIIGFLEVKDNIMTNISSNEAERIKNEIMSQFEGKKRIPLPSLPIPLPGGLHTIVKPKFGAWLELKINPEGKLKVEAGLGETRIDYDLELAMNYLLGEFYPKKAVIKKATTDNPLMLDFSGSFSGDFALALDLGFQLDFPHMKIGKEKRKSYMGAYISPELTGKVNWDYDFDVRNQVNDLKLSLDGEFKLNAKWAVDIGTADIEAFQMAESYNLIPKEAKWNKWKKTWFLNRSPQVLFNEYPFSNNFVRIEDGTVPTIRFKWRDNSKANWGEYQVKKYEVYLGQTKNIDDMKLIATIDPFTDGEACTNFEYKDKKLAEGQYFWYVKAVYQLKAEEWSEVTSFYVTKHVEYVDLGLPSGTLWSSCNIGAEKPEQNGDYLAWGETSGYDGGKKTFSWDNYRYCKGTPNSLTKYCTIDVYGFNGYFDLNRTVLDPEDDVATATCGQMMGIPTKEEWDELIDNCKFDSFYDGVLVTGKNGNTIFLPKAGYRSGTNLYDDTTDGYYWTSSLDTQSPDNAWFVYIGEREVNDNFGYYRYQGRSIRPVFRGDVGSAKAESGTPQTTPPSPLRQAAPVARTFGDGLVIKTVSASNMAQ